MNHLEEIRAKLSIEELVGQYVQLKKAGRNLKGLCPFHNDSRPSFMISPEKGIAYCFACNTGGDIFKIIQLMEKVEFPEAVRILAERTGVKLPEYKPEVQDERRRLLDMNQVATEFFSEQLKSDFTAKTYFQERGLTEETQDEFKLGFAPDSFSSLKDHLKEKGYTEKEMLLAGLVSQRSVADGHTFDRFRGRVIFPINDAQGNAVGFGGRILKEGEPKYLNSPDTPLYNKSYVMYGLNLAKQSIKEADLAIVVEGYMDVIACHQAGTKNVVATSGTALTSSQIQLLKRYTKNLAFAFDQDSAGMEATKRAIGIAEQEGMNIKIILLPNGKDPDEAIRESKESWLKAIEKAVPVMDFYFAHALKQFDKTSLEGKKTLMQFLLPLIKNHPTAFEQNEYLNRLALELKTDVKLLWQDMKNIKNERHYASPEVAEKPLQKPNFSREAFLLAFILNFPEFYEQSASSLADFSSSDADMESIYKKLKNVYDSGSKIEMGLIKEGLTPELQEKVDLLSLLVDEYYPDLDHKTAEKEVSKLVGAIQREKMESVRKEFVYKIRAAQDPDERNSLLNEYNQLLKHTNS